MPRVIRLILTCVVSLFLFKGAAWARWFAGTASALSVVLSIISWFGLKTAQTSMFSLVGIWMVLMAAYYAWVAFMLILDKDVSQHFNPRSGF